jgi:(E)-4-hydroxy-3-methyl-but-2-enyl pyrophosphate reductase
MIIRLARHSGFCFGVKRAIQIALDAADNNQPIYTLGPLIHNPQSVENLRQHGILMAEKAEDLHDSTVIIRSHGITLQERETLLQNGNTLIDATCPFVSRAQEYVSQLCAEGYPVIIMGDSRHPEVIAMLSYCSGEVRVVETPEDLPEKTWNKLGVLSQTTRKPEDLQALVSRLVPRVKELRLFNTICTATSQRQSATTELAKNSDLMIVIGGRNSSNTKMLAALCSDYTDTVHIETAAEIGAETLSGKERIGITAGASTPDYLIVEVFNKINIITGNRTTVTSVEDIPVNKEESC